MKNIFKSLMFVAVAAMTFTACEKDNAENNNNNGTEQKTAITFNAEFADTRSYFTENNGEGYASAWTEGDEVKFQAVNYYSAGEYYTSVGNPTAYIDENNCLSATFNGIQSGDEIKAYSPATKWNVSVSMYGIADDYTIPSEQTPTAASVDPQAHILMAETTYTGSNNMSLTFAHQVAYGKMSLTNFAGTGATAVILDIDGTNYTIKLDNINIATDPIWFACEPNGKVSNMTVTVNATEGGYTKQIITGGDKNLEFLQGQVSNFSVDMNGVTSGEAVDTFNPDVTYDTLVWNSNRFELTGGNSAGMTRLILHADARPGNNSIKVGSYTYDGYTSNYTSPSAENMFRLRNLNGDLMSGTSGATLDVSFENNQYTIIIGFNGKTYGYRGMPDGWVAPAGGGNEGGEEPEPVPLATPTNVECTVTGANVEITWNAVTNASSYNVTLGEQTQNVTTATAIFENVAAGTYDVKVVAVGTGNYTNSEAANAEVTVEAAGEGGGSEPEEPSVIALTSVIYELGSTDITFNSASDTITGTISYSGSFPNGNFTVVGGEPTTGQIGNVKLNGSAVTPEGTVKAAVNYGTGCIDFTVSIVINGTTYNGTVSAQLQ